jgi:hypothetical protein
MLRCHGIVFLTMKQHRAWPEDIWEPSVFFSYPYRWLDVSTYLEDPVTSKLQTMVFLCLQENAESVPKLQVAAARFSYNPQLLWTPQNYIFKFRKSHLT